MINTYRFREQHSREFQEYEARYRELLFQNLIPFWQERMEDKLYGGCFNYFNRKGELTCTDKPGWFAGRNLYFFSALCNTFGSRQDWMHMADQCYHFLRTHGLTENGRFHFMLDRSGKVLQGPVSIHTDHFAVKGIIEYLAAQGPQASAEEISFAQALADRLFENTQDAKLLAMEGIPEGFQKHSINFMNLITALESRKVFGTRYEEILRRAIEKSLHEFASDSYHAAFEYIGLDCHPKVEQVGRIMDAGHCMESLWFSMEAGRMLGRPEYSKRAEEVLDWVIERCWDSEYGGFFAFVDVLTGVPEPEQQDESYGRFSVKWSDKVWWVQAEALVALAASAVYNENETHWLYFKRLHQYVTTYFMDSEYGEWYTLLTRDGHVLIDEKGSELKGPYHVPRCAMQLIKLFSHGQEIRM